LRIAHVCYSFHLHLHFAVFCFLFFLFGCSCIVILLFSMMFFLSFSFIFSVAQALTFKELEKKEKKFGCAVDHTNRMILNDTKRLNGPTIHGRLYSRGRPSNGYRYGSWIVDGSFVSFRFVSFPKANRPPAHRPSQMGESEREREWFGGPGLCIWA